MHERVTTTSASDGRDGTVFGPDRPQRTRATRGGWARIASVALLMALTIAISIVEYLRAFEERAIATAGEQLTMVAATVADDVDALLLERSHAVVTLARELGKEADLGSRTVPALLRGEQDDLPDIELVDVVDASGRVVAATNPASLGADRSDRLWFSAAREAGSRIFGPHLDEFAPHDLTVGITAPIVGDDGRLLGVVREELSMAALLYRVRRRVRVIGDDATRIRALEWILLDHDGLIIAESDLAGQGRVNLRQLGLPSAAVRTPGWTREEHGRIATQMVTGHAELGLAGPSGSPAWRVLVRVQERDVLKPMRFLLGRLVAGVSLVLMPLALLLGRLVFERRRAEQELRDAHAQLERRIGDRTGELSAANAALESEVRERRRTEAALREREAQLADFFENAPVGLHWLGPDGTILRANRAELTMLGYEAREYVGHDVRAFHADIDVVEDFLVRLARGETLEAREARLRCRDGSIRTVLVDANVLWRDGEFMHARCFTRDVTERQRVDALLEEGRRRAEQQARALERQTLELEQARNQALAAARAKAAFLANMSHEIRTPMTAILGYAELLSDRRLSPRIRQDYVKTVRHNGEHLLRLLNDILDLSKLEAGKMTVEHVACSPAHLAREVEAMLRGRATGGGLHLDLVVGPDVPLAVLSDPTRIRQILVNLVGNAIKFTYAGGVRLAVDGDEPSPEGRVRIRFAVADTGIGMTAEEQARLFAPFVQADTSTSRRFGGTGLGLTISSRLAEALGGSLAVTSTPGAGCTFTLTLDVDVAPAAIWPGPGATGRAEDEIDEPRLRGRILLAEDAPDSQRLLAFYLRRAGAQVDVVDNGRLACERVRNAVDAGASFDLILMDMQMPEMDGYQATAQLRAMGVETPIVALTAHSMDGDRERCLQAGCTDYLAKPIERVPFLRHVRDHLDATRGKARSVKTNGTVRRSNGAEPELQDLMVIFVAGLRQRAEALEATLQQNDLERLAGLAHQLKGTARAYGFPQLTDQAAALEASLIAGRCLDDVRAQVQCVVELCRAAGCQ
jgi:PAS domain S-box-containing protein